MKAKRTLTKVIARAVHGANRTRRRLLLFTGCRLREILHLKWEHMNFERGQAMLRPAQRIPNTSP